MTEFFPTDLLTECDDNKIILSRSHSTSNSTTARTNSWENWLAQEKRRFSDESIGSNWKGASGISNIFRKDTMDLEDDEENIEPPKKTHEKTPAKDRHQSMEKLGNIREETNVERIVDNFEGLNPPAPVTRSVSRESRSSVDDEKQKKTHTRTSSGSSIRDFMSSMNATLRRNKSSGHHEDKLRRK